MVCVLFKNLFFPSSRPSSSSISQLLPTVNTPQTYGSTMTSSPRKYFCEECPRQSVALCEASTGETGFRIEDHVEKRHSKALIDPRVISDAIIGLSDGLTVPFALTAGLSAFNDTKVVLYGGIAELIAGSISMGLGGWLAGRGEAEFYESTLQSTKSLVTTAPDSLPPILYSIFAPYNLPPSSLRPLIDSLLENPSSLVSFMMQFQHNLPSPDAGTTKRTPLSSALTIAMGYFLGGFIPLLPYFFVARENVLLGLWWSVGVMAICLFFFGVGKTVLVSAEEDTEGDANWKANVQWRKCCRAGVEMMVVGGVAAGAAMGIVRALGS
ncbi:Protein ccc1 [Rhizina undulata]